MKKITKFLLLFALILLLSGCDEWDDLADSISGSGDDDSAVTDTDTDTDTDDDDDDDSDATEYETKFHHTTTASSDGGKSLVLCSGQSMGFDSCSVGTVNIPRHSDDNGRETYWNMTKEPVGDITCKKGGKSYKYKASKTVEYGKCS